MVVFRERIAARCAFAMGGTKEHVEGSLFGVLVWVTYHGNLETVAMGMA
jgi:hypothetical protein